MRCKALAAGRILADTFRAWPVDRLIAPLVVRRLDARIACRSARLRAILVAPAVIGQAALLAALHEGLPFNIYVSNASAVQGIKGLNISR